MVKFKIVSFENARCGATVESIAGSGSAVSAVSHQKNLVRCTVVGQINDSSLFWINQKNYVKMAGSGKVEEILKDSLDLIPSPSSVVKIQIIGEKVCLRYKGKTLLVVVNF